MKLKTKRINIKLKKELKKFIVTFKYQQVFVISVIKALNVVFAITTIDIVITTKTLVFFNLIVNKIDIVSRCQKNS